ncbi:hypothetical protein JMJ35_002921 [Cladonia borealis]|uniref:Integral membrane protein n=1 Tax=Cladonia borealis TaxID=184061 RepID=A0AA39V6J3_9LECA|nr:hypothetical protein JMJ35_002921 [Cladonia borealis]
MALPSFLPLDRQRKPPSNPSSISSPSASAPNYAHPTTNTIKAATKTRLHFSLLSSLLYFIALIFLILVQIGSTHAHKPVLGNIYFLKLDLSQIIPESVPQSDLINSIARTLGLHDFYQVGLWGFCEGYGSSITDCSKPVVMYWFDPVEIILSELLAGATIALPQNVISALSLVRLASHWMFALFLVGTIFSFISIFLTPFSLYTRLLTIPISIVTFLTALTTTAATIIATVLFIIFKKVIHSAEDTVNIVPEIGREMFAFMWIATACVLVGWGVQVGLCCCCASRRDVRLGKKLGGREAWENEEKGEGKGRRGLWGKKMS